MTHPDFPRTFFTSDHHFAHANIVEYCSRPFRDVEEMNEELVRRWNEVVRPQDSVFHLGDFAMGPASNINHFRAQLNGQVTLALGNHDRSVSRMTQAGFSNVAHSMVLETQFPDGQWRRILLCHRPPRDESWRSPPGGGVVAACLHGHVHNAYRRRGDLYNVGVDVRGFRPVTLEEILREDRDGDQA